MLSSFEKSKAASLSKIREHMRLYELKQSRTRILEKTALVRTELLASVWNGDTPMSMYDKAKKSKERQIARVLKKIRDKAERKRKLDLIEQIKVKKSTLIRLMSIRTITIGEKTELLAKLRKLEKQIPRFYLPNGACETCRRKPCECDIKLRFRSKHPYISKNEANIYLLFTLGCYIRKRRLTSAIIIQKTERGRQDRFYVEYLLKTRRRKRAKLLRRSLKKEISNRRSLKIQCFN